MLEAVVWGGLGLIFGSFTNVLIVRHGHASLGGRSACPDCKRTLEWYELIPVLSWILLRGRCRTCRKRISLQYPLVELMVGGLFLLIGFAPLPLVEQMVGALIAILLVAIAIYDLRYMIMPDAWVFSFAGLSLAYAFLEEIFHGGSFFSAPIEILLAGPVIALPLWLLWRVSKGKWMGFGDVKFALGMGWLLGIWYGFIALTLSFILGALVGVLILLPLPYILRVFERSGITRFHSAQAGFTMKSEVPFGPFLILATCILWFGSIYAYDPILSLPEVFLFWNFSW